MKTRTQSVPVVLSFTNLDPSGGTGIHADIEAIGAMGCHCAPIATVMMVQDSANAQRFVPTPDTVLMEQARVILEDMPVKAIKIAMPGSVENIRTIHTILQDYPHIPVVLDVGHPAITHTRLEGLDIEERNEAIRVLLLPHATLCTANGPEARAFAPGADTLDACAQDLLGQGVGHLLITGGHENTPKIINRYYSGHRLLQSFDWPRLETGFYGAGCTLNASIAALLAQGMEPQAAVHQAQEYTWECLKHGYRIGMGQLVPNRLYWSRDGMEL